MKLIKLIAQALTAPSQLECIALPYCLGLDSNYGPSFVVTGGIEQPDRALRFLTMTKLPTILLTKTIRLHFIVQVFQMIGRKGTLCQCN